MHDFEFWNFLKEVSSNIGSITVVTGFVFAIIKPLRKWVINIIRQWAGYNENLDRDSFLNERLDNIEESLQVIISQQKCIVISNQDLLRNSINHMYFKYEQDQKLPAYEKENLIKMYNSYVALGGNSYIEQLYKTMVRWPPYQKLKDS